MWYRWLRMWHACDVHVTVSHITCEIYYFSHVISIDSHVIRMRHIRPACDDRKYYMRNPLKFRMRFAFVACVSHVTYMWWSRISHAKTTGVSHAITVFVHVIHRVAHVIHMRSAGDDRKYCMRNPLNFRMRFGFVARNSHLMQTNITCENHRIFACDICYCACDGQVSRMRFAGEHLYFHMWTFTFVICCLFSHVKTPVCHMWIACDSHAKYPNYMWKILPVHMCKLRIHMCLGFLHM